MLDYEDNAMRIEEKRICLKSVEMYCNGMTIRAIARCFMGYFSHSEKESIKFVSRSIYEAKLKGEC